LDFPKLPPSKRVTHQYSVIVSCLVDLNCVTSGRNLMVSDLHVKLIHEWYVIHTRYHGHKVAFDFENIVLKEPGIFSADKAGVNGRMALESLRDILFLSLCVYHKTFPNTR
jgi:hypothetical protein